MKKTALLLAFLLLFTFALSACNGNGAESEPESIESETPSDESASEEGSSAEESKTESSAEESLPPEEYTYASVISSGKSYTKSQPAGDSYPDTYGTELTDGLFAVTESPSYTDENFVGVAESFQVEIDLGEVYDRIYQFETSYLATTQAGIGSPASVRIYVSEDGKEWTRTGTSRFPKYEEDTIQRCVLHLDHPVSARYVRFDIKRSSHWLFVDEVMVIADIASGDVAVEWEKAVTGLYDTETQDSETYANALAQVSTGSADRMQKVNNVALNCKYTCTGKSDKTYPDENGKLTDGMTAGFYQSGGWVGYRFGDGDMELVVDLGSVRTDVSAFEVFTYNNKTVKISFPLRISFAVSTDKKEWVEIGRCYAPLCEDETFVYTLQLDSTVRARYVRFTLAKTECDRILLEEVRVLAYSDSIKAPQLYPDLEFPEVTGSDLWPADSADYGEEIDLIKGLGQQIACDAEPERASWPNNTPVTSKLLTDGKRASGTDIHNGYYFKFNRSGTRDVYYDLGHLSAVSSFTAEFTHQTAWAVECPEKVKILVSEDAKTWYLAGEIIMPVKDDPSIVKGELKLDKPVAARFVCFEFTVNTWSGCDELEVFGNKKLDGAVSLADSGYSTGTGMLTNSFLAPSEDLLGGASDIYLAYHGTKVERTVEDLMPAVAYLDTDGNVKDVMFDGFLFLLTGSMPSGYAGHEGYTVSDVDWLINTLFKEGRNVCALDEAAGLVKERLGLPDDYKYKYYVSLYGLNSTDPGDIDGDGVKENMSVLADRVKFTEEVIKRFEKAMAEHPFENIKFCGYYWYHESLDDANGDMQLLNAISDMIHAHGSQFFWIPWFKAYGYSLWKEHGFDAACMQPNYMFKLEVPFSNIHECASLAKRYGMCVEIEFCSNAMTDQRYRTRYMQYLSNGVTEGYMKDVIHMYYLETTSFIELYKSTYLPNRAMYDYTYRFIKGTLVTVPDAKDPISFEAEAGKICKGNLTDDETGMLSFEVDSSPKHGTVTINLDGSFAYYPDKGYTGEDSFTYRYSEQLDYSAPCVVNITVE